MRARTADGLALPTGANGSVSGTAGAEHGPGQALAEFQVPAFGVALTWLSLLTCDWSLLLVL
jgi:hypothetical protein